MAEGEATSSYAKPLYNYQKRIREDRKSEQPSSSGTNLSQRLRVIRKGKRSDEYPGKKYVRVDLK